MDDKDTILVYGVVGDDLVFMKKDEAVSRAQIMDALESSKTWGDFEAKVSKEEYQELMERIRGFNGREEHNGETDFEVFYRNWLECDSSVTREKARLEYDKLPVGKRLPGNADRFDVTEIPGFCDGDWPWWPAQRMLFWLPKSIQERYGKRTTVNPSFS